MKNSVRLGVIGLGVMGAHHARSVLEGKVLRCELAGVCDGRSSNLASFPGIPGFLTTTEMFDSGVVDAVLIATPHYSHTTIGIEALKAGVHVLVEKPISVHKADCERLLAAHRNPQQVFAAMFNQRTDPVYLRLHEIIQKGELGPLRRICWTASSWFRTQAYYDSGSWRATWAGEGGGVLLNQCPHQLDLWQWLFGMPRRIRAFCRIGHYHEIEVEDDVTAYMEYDNGASGVLITSTGESPGTNRLEVVGDLGKIVVEDNAIKFTRNEVSMREFCRNDKSGMDRPAAADVPILLTEGRGSQHIGILNNFVAAILDGERLLAPASEGIRSIELANGMLMSTFENRTIELPLGAEAYEAALNEKIANSKAGAIPVAG